jgi:hypothetical protein
MRVVVGFWPCPRPRFVGGARSKAALRAASCASAAKAVFPFSRAALARVNSCPSRACWALGSWFCLSCSRLASAAEGGFPFSRADSARVTSCPSRACWAFGFVVLPAVHGLPQRLKPGSLFRGLFRHEWTRALPSLVGLRVRGSALAVHGLPQRLKPVPVLRRLRHE